MGRYLPLELISEILCLLPAKSVLRFQSVSKSWRSLMCSPPFIKSHLQHSTKTKSNSVTVGYACAKENMITDPWDHFWKSELCLAGLHSPGNNLVKPDLPDPVVNNRFPFKFSSIQVRGSDNGLICLTMFDCYVIISNMTTQDYHMIPSIPSVPFYKEKRGVEKFKPNYGFGFNPIDDDYKLLKIVICEYKGDYYAETTVYSLRLNAWSKIKRGDVSGRKMFPKICRLDGSMLDGANGVVASGALHWLSNANSLSFILAFDLATEEFHELQLPDYVREQQEIQIRERRRKYIEYTRVGVLEGSLCVSTRVCMDDPFYDIWITRDYKVQDSWTKLFRIISNGIIKGPLTPLVCTDHEVLLLERYQGFCWSNLKKRQLIHDPNFYSGLYSTVICLGTVVSLSPYRALWEEAARARARKIRRKSRDSSNNTQSQVDARVKEALMYFFIFQKMFNSIQSKC